MCAATPPQDKLEAGRATDGFTGLGVALAGFAVDYFAGVVPGTTRQAPVTVVRIGILTCIVPAVLSIVSACFILFYDLTRGRVALVKAALAERGDSTCSVGTSLAS